MSEAKAGRSKKTRPKCHKIFLRLDTHLKNNHFCKVIPPIPSIPETTDQQNDHEGSPSSPEHHLRHGSTSSASASIAAAPLEMPPELIPALKLPSSDEEY